MRLFKKLLICVVAVSVVFAGFMIAKMRRPSDVNQDAAKPDLKEVTVRADNPYYATADKITMTKFYVELEHGDVEVVAEDNTLRYFPDQSRMRSKEGEYYKAPRGTIFELSDYSDGSVLALYISYDGGKTFNTVGCYAEAPRYVLEQNAHIALKISSTKAELIKITIPSIYDWIEENESWGTGKTIVNIGDDIFCNGDSDSVSALLSRFSGATVYNCAFEGTCAAVADRDDAYEAFDFANLADAICTQNWDSQEEQIDNNPDRIGFKSRLANIRKIDFSKVDVLIVAYGTNDWSLGANALSEVTAALEKGIRQINKTYPFLKIVLVSPIWRCVNGTSSDTADFGAGTLEDFSVEYEKLARKLKVPYLDAYNKLTFNFDTRAVFYEGTADSSMCLNAEGRKKYAEILNGKLKLLF